MSLMEYLHPSLDLACNNKLIGLGEFDEGRNATGAVWHFSLLFSLNADWLAYQPTNPQCLLLPSLYVLPFYSAFQGLVGRCLSCKLQESKHLLGGYPCEGACSNVACI